MTGSNAVRGASADTCMLNRARHPSPILAFRQEHATGSSSLARRVRHPCTPISAHHAGAYCSGPWLAAAAAGIEGERATRMCGSGGVRGFRDAEWSSRELAQIRGTTLREVGQLQWGVGHLGLHTCLRWAMTIVELGRGSSTYGTLAGSVQNLAHEVSFASDLQRRKLSFTQSTLD